MVKLHLPVDSFVQCANAKRPDNTLFPDVSSFTIGYPDLETYLPLILVFFQVSPEGNLVCSRYKDHEETFFDFIHQCVLSNFMDMILRGILWPPHRKCVQLNGQGKLFQFEQGEDKERAAAVGTE